MAAVSSGGSVCCLPDCPARPLPAHLLLCAPTAVPTTLRSKRPATLPAPLRTAAQHAPVHWWSLWWRLSQKRATRRARLVGRGTHCSYSTQHIHLSVSGGSNPPSPYDPSPATPTLAIPPPPAGVPFHLQVDIATLSQSDVMLALTNCLDVLLPAITTAGLDINALADLATCPTPTCLGLPGASADAPAPAPEAELTQGM